MIATAQRTPTQITRYRGVHFDPTRGAHGAYIEVEATRGKDETGSTWQIDQHETGTIYPVRGASRAAQRETDKVAGAAILAWNSDRANTGPFPADHA